jgi:hypothetical protein
MKQNGKSCGSEDNDSDTSDDEDECKPAAKR